VLRGRQFYAQITKTAIEGILVRCTIIRRIGVCSVTYCIALQAVVVLVIAYKGCVPFCNVQYLTSPIVLFYIPTIVDW